MLEHEQQSRERMAREAAERHLFLNVRILTDKDIAGYQGFDLQDFASESSAGFLTVKVRKDEPWCNVKVLDSVQ